MSNEHYLNNPLIHQNRRVNDSEHHWVKQFDCTHIKPLIICRGPIRKEAIDVFTEMGIEQIGILLSEKDSIVYQNALAPELRQLPDPSRVHRVPDYTGVDKEERDVRIKQIIKIAKDNGYNAIFAGYGFMAEDENMVSAMETAGLTFIGPCSRTVHDAGLKDEAKRTALKVGVSVTPGVDNATTLTLLRLCPTEADLKKLAKKHALALPSEAPESLEEFAEQVLTASYKKGVDLFSIGDLQQTIHDQVLEMNRNYPENRIRLKCIGGGGGKGQRILPNPADFKGDLEKRLQQVANKAPSLVLEILNEVKATGQGDNKNVLIELNIETTRHQEIQVIGNGTWTLALGGRDCSLQMHEQKLLEVSVTSEDLSQALSEAVKEGRDIEAKILSQDIKTLQAMETEAEKFGEAVGLDNVSTFECIVDRDQHFFMEMNTRIQVEHRVTELCYSLKFANPDNADECFVVDSLVEAMVLLAAHGQKLPKPERVVRHTASVEARLNATNHALAPHAGGVIEHWSDAQANEIRDDQGISLHNPDTGSFMAYHLAGAYDSNIALLLTTGHDRLDSYQRLANILRVTELEGKDLATNLEFHYGLVNWFLGNNINARPTTRFIVPYLTAVGELKQQANDLDVDYAYQTIAGKALARVKKASTQAALKKVYTRKQLLLTRPIKEMLSEPHIMAGWLSMQQNSYEVSKKGTLTWLRNPIDVLEETYHFLNMNHRDDHPPASMIWDHDQSVLADAKAFYQALQAQLGELSYSELNTLLSAKSAPEGFSEEPEWAAIQAAHSAYQAGCDILLLLPYIAHESGFHELKVNEDLSIHIPEKLTQTEHQVAMAKVLVPPPVAKSDEILATSGGMFYACEAPGMPPFIEAGQHFEAGDALYIVEVMKMFNKVKAPFAGTIEKVLIEEDGTIIKKGQPIFKITPDEQIVIESDAEIAARKQGATDRFIGNLA